MHISATDKLSRTLPAPARAIAATASSSYSLPTARSTFLRCSSRSLCGMSLKSKRIQRERMVAGSLCGSVVARIKTACFGGSSSVFKRALNAESESICTSSTI